MTWQAFILKLVELLQPRFYNRITWLIVIAGIAMMSTPLWEKIANELLKKELEISISDGNDAAWGFALCVLGLVYHMANTGFYELVKTNEACARKDRERQHDVAIFQKANALLTEEQLSDFLHNLKADHSCYTDTADKLDNFLQFLAATSNQFLTPQLASEANELQLAWKDLGHFISNKFYIFPNNQTEPPFRLCMAPYLNMDRDGNGSLEQILKYDKLIAELDELSGKLDSCYRRFRATIKNELVI